MLRGLTGSILSLALLAGAAQAGVEIQLEERVLPSGRPVEQVSLVSERRRLKMESRGHGEASAAEAMLFDGERREMIVISHERRSYIRMDEDSATQVGGQVSAAMEQMKAQLANLPAEQRAMVEQMMKQRMPGAVGPASAPKKEYRRSSETAEKAGHPCTRVDVHQDGERIRVHWVTDRDNLKLAEETFAVLADAAGFAEALGRSMGSKREIDNPMEALDELGGFPVLTIDYENGKPTKETVLTSIARREVAATELRIPEGFEEQRLPTPGSVGKRR